jgi:hypothetical protein
MYCFTMPIECPMSFSRISASILDFAICVIANFRKPLNLATSFLFRLLLCGSFTICLVTVFSPDRINVLSTRFSILLSFSGFGYATASESDRSNCCLNSGLSFFSFSLQRSLYYRSSFIVCLASGVVNV